MLSSLLLSNTSAAASSHVGIGGTFDSGVALTGCGEGSGVVGEGDGVGLSVSLSLLLSKTIAAASFHVGMGGILAVL